jgi:surfeit locus 1 family protein
MQLVTRRTLSITPRGIVGTIIVMIVASACIRLGFWQLDRRAQRAERNAMVEARLDEPVIDLQESPRDTAGWLYRRVTVSGQPDAANAIVLPGRMYRGAPGANVLIPVRMAGGTSILVDIGWVPAADGATVDFDALALDEPVTGMAVAMPFPGEEPGARRPPAGTDLGAGGFRRVWYAVDAAAIRRQVHYELGSVLLQLVPDTDAPAYPVRRPPPELDPGPHLGYAIQWFSFATIALVGWMAMVVRSGSVRSGEPQ